VRLQFEPKRISEARLRELLLVSPYDLAMLMPPSLEECIARDDWREFLNTVGVDEEIIGTPHCSSPGDTDELDAH